MQKAYISTLYELMRINDKVISCLSDSGTDYDELIAREFPDRVINFGISENNQVTAAAGMAVTGKIPFVYTTGAFIAYRSYEFLRDDICLQNRNVKLVGMGAGLSWSTLGVTHHTTEDLALLKSLPNLTVLNPSLVFAVKAAYRINGPVYIRMGMSGEEEIYQDDVDFSVGKNMIVTEGTDAVVFCTGSIIAEALKAVKGLQRKGKNIRLIDVHTIVPFDEKSVVDSMDCGCFFSVEEHSVVGGLGSSIADVIAKYGLDKRLVKIGLKGFAEGFGTHAEVLMMNHLDSNSILETIEGNLYGQPFSGLC